MIVCRGEGGKVYVYIACGVCMHLRVCVCMSEYVNVCLSVCAGGGGGGWAIQCCSTLESE